MKLIVLGMMGGMPFAGMAWQALHYLEGFRRLGHDVWYIEDTGNWPFDLDKNTLTDDCTYTIRYLARVMHWAGLDDHWAYRGPAPENRLFGLSDTMLARVLQEADVLINLHGATLLREEYLAVPLRVYVETDPVLPQIAIAKGSSRIIEMMHWHTHYFTFGENVGTLHCRVPTGGLKYHPTRQPVVIDWWNHGNNVIWGREAFTTITNWKQIGNDVEWEGEIYRWSKHCEFLKFLDLPSQSPRPLELALAANSRKLLRELKAHGWQVADAITLSRDILPYRDYILGSAGEFTVAKDLNVRLRSGWFSDRSACYLAAGRPVVTQDTGFGSVLPTGAGLFSFNTVQEVIEAFEKIELDYRFHSDSALAIAEEHFRAETVLKRMIEVVC